MSKRTIELESDYGRSICRSCGEVSGGGCGVLRDDEKVRSREQKDKDRVRKTEHRDGTPLKVVESRRNKLAKINEAKMVIYNALPRKEYERIFMCNTTKEIWKTLLVTHQDESIDSDFARFNTIITSLKALDESYSSKNYVRKFLRALHPKWRAKVTAIKESKDLTSLSHDEFIGNIKARKESSDEECLTSGSEDEEYVMACFRCGYPNHLIGECLNPLKDKNQKAFVEGSWSDSGEEDDEKVKNETCLVAQASSEVCSESSYFSDENSSIDDLVLDNEYDKLCKMSLKIITKNKRLKAARTSLEKEISILKEKVSTLEKNKEVDLECVKCHMLKIENEKLKEEAHKLTKFEKSTHCLNEMLNNQKPSREKLGLWFNSFEASSNGTKEIKCVKAQKKASSDGGPINIGDPLNVQAAPKANMGPPPGSTPGSEKSVSFQKSILGPRPKHIIVNNVKVLVASDNEVKQFYKPLSKPEVGFSKPNFRSKTPPLRRVTNNYYRPKTPQPKRNVGRQNQPRGFPICLGVDLEPDESIKDSGCSKHMTGNRNSSQATSNILEGNVSFVAIFARYHLDKEITSSTLVTKAKNIVSTTRCLELLHLDLFGPSDVRGYGGNRYTLVIVDDYSRLPPNSKAYIILNKHTRKVKESLNVTFDETPPPSKISPLVDDDLDEEEAIKVIEKKNLENDIEDETLEIDEIVNIKESRNHPLENLDENGIVSRNKARILLAYACALDFKLFQMDVKFLNSFNNEEVYAAQPPRFIDFKKPDHVYKLKKALYGLKQAPKAWYDRLKVFLIKNEYKMGMVDNIIFTKKKSSNLIIVQIYVDDIIFSSTCQDICDKFAKIIHNEFEMSMMGELNFFLGLQIKQMEEGIFFDQSKYIKEMLKKFGLEESKPMKTPMPFDTKLMKDEECESVDSTKYQGMIGSLLYLTASWPDIMFSVCLCARFQKAPKTSHLEAVKRIFRYIKGTTHLGLWYPEGTNIETVVYAYSDHAGDYVDRKSTSSICTFLGCCLTSWFSKKQTALAISTTEAEYVSVGKACQQALWMKQALIDYDVRLDDVPIMCDNKCAIYLSKNLGACVFSDKWSLDELAYGVPTDGPYQNNHPSPDDIIYESLELLNESYILYDHVLNPLTTQQERKTRKDHDTRRGRHSTSSSSAFDQPSSSHLNDDDNDGNDEGTSRASTPSTTRFVNLLTNDVPQVFQNPPNIDPDMEPFYTRQTEIINRQVQLRDEHRGGDGIGGGDGGLKAKSSEVIGERLSLEAIDDEDVPLMDGVLDGSLGAFGERDCCFGNGVCRIQDLDSTRLLSLRFEKMPWKYLRLKMSADDDNLKVRIGNHFIKRKWFKNGVG
ncbi:retrovirus-related pol polyprotein from transposon TNT 1-94 [Tanacetum coccineum]|uniref:Retrovirus-related pol polyprotein from transposon TNT 1-94 n=1 Tax=Tanacetum coccineum TaxID=301880 RepID=A0ABQ5EUT4_9ASTR